MRFTLKKEKTKSYTCFMTTGSINQFDEVEWVGAPLFLQMYPILHQKKIKQPAAGENL